MKNRCSIAFVLLLAACEPLPVAQAPRAPLIDGLGSASMPISVRDARAR